MRRRRLNFEAGVKSALAGELTPARDQSRANVIQHALHHLGIETCGITACGITACGVWCGMSAILGLAAGIAVVGEASDAEGAVAIASLHSPPS